MYKHKEEDLYICNNTCDAAESGPIKMSERFQLQLARLPSTTIAAVHSTPSWLWGVYKNVSSSSESKDTSHWHSEGFTSIKLHGFLTVHPRAEPYRTEHSSSRFGSARIFSNRTLSSASIETPDSVRLALENFERGGDSARKCTVRFGSARGCTVR
jgi:hypothetical protein